MRNGDSVNRRIYAAYKQDLFRQLNGNVLDVGAGTGLNLAFAPDNVTRWIAAEPNSAFHGDIQSEALNHPFQVVVSSMDAHHLELPANSVDSVVCTLVLCSVDSPSKVLAEIVRVLKPGGAFVFIEHVLAHSQVMQVAQNAFNPLNRLIADGCNCNRDTQSVVEKSGLDVIRLDSVQVKGITPFHKPHIMGFAVKPFA
jgi:ubiquinone/menaquinone biosynthesis C-methylase UbiE